MRFERWLYTVPLRLRSLFRSNRVEQELDDELQFHIERLTEEHVARGVVPAEARLAALRSMHGVEQRKEECRDARHVRVIEDLTQDLRYAVRMLRRSPTFTAVAVLTLALGIGANTAIFSLMDAVMLRTLPVTDPDRLVIVQSLNPAGRGGSSFSYPQFTSLREHARTVAQVFAYAPISLNLSAQDLTDAPTGVLVSDNYFSVLGVEPVVGRGFTSSDDSGAVLSYRYWQARFQGSGAVVGRQVALNGVSFTVIGVAPRRFFGVEVGHSPDVFVPLAVRDRLAPGAPQLQQPNRFWLNVMARLEPGITAQRAAEQATAVYQQNVSDLAGTIRPGLLQFLRQRRITLAPGAMGLHSIAEQFGAPLRILIAVVSLVLLIAHANVAGLLLARATARRREIAIRLALGAGRGRVVRQLLTESLVLSAAGGAAGLLFGVWSSNVLTGFLSNRVLDVRLDARVLGFTLLTSAITAVLFGAAPAWRGTRTDLTPAFKSEPSAPLRIRARFGRLLVPAQVALSLLLLVGAGLFIRTLANLRAMDAGFRGGHVLLATVDPGLSRYTPERVGAFYTELVGRMSALPGVHSASIADAPLLSGSYIDGLSIEGSKDGAETSLRIVGPRFFETMGIHLRLGRDFSVDDRVASPKVGIVNETIARKFFAGQNPIGKHVGLGGIPDIEIIGIIGDTKYRALRETIPNTLYLPMDQAQFAGSERTLHVRTTADPGGMVSRVREQVRALDSNLPVKLRLFSDLVDENLVQERLIATLSGFFGGLALILTAIGLYGGLAYVVQHRTHEIGIRISMGAERRALIWLILRECLVTVITGIAIGLPASLWLSTLVRSQLFGLIPHDSGTLISAVVLIVVIAALAGYLPARRASRVDPIAALRCE